MLVGISIGKEVSLVSDEDLGYMKNRFGQQGIERLYEIVCETKFIELDPQQISKRIEEIGHEISALVFQKENLEQKLREQRSSLIELDGEINDMERKRSILQAQQGDILKEAAKLEEELTLVNSELQEVNETLETVKKKEEVHRMAEANKAFAHYRW